MQILAEKNMHVVGEIQEYAYLLTQFQEYVDLLTQNLPKIHNLDRKMARTYLLAIPKCRGLTYLCPQNGAYLLKIKVETGLTYFKTGLTYSITP